MSATRHADTARDALIAAAGVAFSATTSAGRDYATAHKAVVAADDVVPAMQAVVSAIMAAEHLRAEVELAIRDLRAVLMVQMDAIGTPNVKTRDGSVTAYLSKKAAWVSVDDEARIPREFFVAPPPSPDKKALKAALQAGTEIPGVSLRVPNDQNLVLRSNAKEWGT